MKETLMDPLRRLRCPEVAEEDVVIGSAFAPRLRGKYLEIRELARDRRGAAHVLKRAE
jgi:hypothetical protein